MATRLYLNDSATDAEKDVAYGLPEGATASFRAWEQANPEPKWNAPQDEGYAHYEARIEAGHDAAHSRELYGWGRLNPQVIGPRDPAYGDADGFDALYVVEMSIQQALSPEAMEVVTKHGVSWS